MKLSLRYSAPNWNMPPAVSGSVLQRKSRQRKRTLALIFCVFATMWFIPVFGQAPKTISYQGYLKNGTTPVTGAHTLTFNIYTVSSGGATIWTESFGSVTVTNGNFNVILGKTTPLTFTPTATLYMGIQIDGGTEITPRVELSAALYSVGLALPYTAAISSTNDMLNLTNSGTGNVINATGKIQATKFVGDGSLLTGITSTPATNTVGSNEIINNSIIDSDVNISAAIAGSKITPNFAAQNISTTGTLNAGATSITGLTVSGASTNINTVGYTWPGAQGGVNTILTNNGSGSLAWTSSSGLSSTLNSANIFVGNGSNIATGVAMSGDATINNSGVLTIGAGSITAAKILDGTIGANDLNAMGATTNQVLQYNGTNWAPTTLAGGGTVTNIATGTGLTGGPITNTGTISLANTTVTPNTYGTSTSVGQFTVDGQGRLTAASSIAIPTATTTATGLLTNTDWNTFNNKLSSIPTLGGDISGTLTSVSVDKLRGTALVATAPTLNQVLQYNGTNWSPSTLPVATTTAAGLLTSADWNTFNNKLGSIPTLGGDISGTLTSVSVDKLKGTSVVATAPTLNQVLQYNGTNWAPATLAGGGSVTNIATGTGLTGGPITGTGTISLANTAVTAGSYGTATSVSQFTVDGQGRLTAASNTAIPTATTTATGLLTNADWNTFNNKLSSIPTLGGDISGTLTSVSVDKLRGTALVATAPTLNQVLQYNGTNWAPSSLPITGWGLTGTAGTVDGTNFIGTTDNIPLNIKVNNQKAGRIDHLQDNTFLGKQAGNASTTGTKNTAIGSGALALVTTGVDNTAVGMNSLTGNTASQNTAMGVSALGLSTTGAQNTAIGRSALYNSTSGGNNVGMGYSSLFTNTTGSNNTAIGYQADVASANLTNATAIGANASVTASNTIQLGDASVTTVNVGSGTSAKLVAGGLQITGGTLGAGKVLTSDGSGNATWQSAAASGWSLTGNATTIGNKLGTTNGNPLTLITNSTDRLIIDATGKVGIGTSAPLSPLQIGSTLGLMDIGSDDILGHGIYFNGSSLLNTSTAAASVMLLGDAHAGFFTFASGSAGGLSGSPTMRFNVKPSGVGIQVDTPIETFQVNGATYLNQITAPSTTTDRLYNVGGSLFWNGINVSTPSATGWGLTGTSGTIDGTNFLGTTDNVALNFKVNNVKAGRIDPAGPVFLGYQAGINNANATAKQNTGIGSNSLLQNTTGNYNVAIGNSALEKNTTGAENTAVGSTALQNNTTGVFNSGFGYGALYTNSTGSYNTAFGNFSGVGNTTGNYNTAYGNNSLYTNTVGSNNTSIGNQTLAFNSAGSNGTAIGAFAMQNYNDSGTPFVNNNVAVGYSALQGSGTPSANTGIQNSAVGYQAMASNTSGQRNAALGYQAMSSNTTGNGNTAVGQNSLSTNSTGGANTAIGTRALYNNTAANNTATGNDALFANVNGTDNAAFGVLSLAGNTASKNTGLGAYSLQSNTTGADNAGVGNTALNLNTSGSKNTSLGSLSGNTTNSTNANVSGNSNTFIGYASGPGSTTQLTNATAIGANATVNQSNSLVLGSINGINSATSNTNVGIGTTTPSQPLDVIGNVKFSGALMPNNTAGSAGQVLTSAGAGLVPTWSTPTTTDLSNITSNIQFANGAARTLLMAPEPNSNDAQSLTIKGSDASSGSQARNGGNVFIDAGHNFNATISYSLPGSVFLRSGGNLLSSGNSQPGDIIFATGGITGSATNYTTRMTIKGNGNIGIGSTSPVYPFQVDPTANYTSTSVHGVLQLTGATTSTPTNLAVSIYSTGAVLAPWFWAFSDKRIKEKVSASNTADDLNLLMRLKITDYNYIDKVTKGSRLQKGFIAQEVKEVLPDAVNILPNSEFIPSIYSQSKSIKKQSAGLEIELTKAHELKVGDRIRFLDGAVEFKETVIEIPSPTSFIVKDASIEANKVFVFGKEISDMHTIEYDRIYTLGISAIQELNKKLTAQQQVIDSLQEQDAKSKKKIALLEASLNKVTERETELNNLKSEVEKIKAALGLSVDVTVKKAKEKTANSQPK